MVLSEVVTSANSRAPPKMPNSHSRPVFSYASSPTHGKPVKQVEAVPNSHEAKYHTLFLSETNNRLLGLTLAACG